mmetsp:Transcript_9501/g.30128  ORF Transcript_9501/g.30128 Transcript_9501/m.30128 type:complete len:221 (-) Transcript_9501:68-730(-)|eukprot:CAMPEP_0170741350 /NCGR_PEP_ID=MMETSP0437-20130122/6171_1 /TAXON_ID=0 /ORGANISM="Sexangularia sp." /LENGTH=220 /DNA_ID=CAMNT_0011079913 /DNA_START=67 /DNA_END=729 /DNA_ORIENTATION=+
MIENALSTNPPSNDDESPRSSQQNAPPPPPSHDLFFSQTLLVLLPSLLLLATAFLEFASLSFSLLPVEITTAIIRGSLFCTTAIAGVRAATNLAPSSLRLYLILLAASLVTHAILAIIVYALSQDPRDQQELAEESNEVAQDIEGTSLAGFLLAILGDVACCSLFLCCGCSFQRLLDESRRTDGSFDFDSSELDEQPPLDLGSDVDDDIYEDTRDSDTQR